MARRTEVTMENGDVVEVKATRADTFFNTAGFTDATQGRPGQPITENELRVYRVNSDGQTVQVGAFRHWLSWKVV